MRGVISGSLVLALLAPALAAPAAMAAFPGKPGPVVYSKADTQEVADGRVDSVGGLYVHGPRVSDRPRPLTDDPDDHSPAVSADGRRVVFVNDDEATRSNSIDVIDIDGSNRREVTRGGQSPAFFPGGEAIVFVRGVGGHSQIFSIRLDGTGLRQLTRGPFDHYDPAVSPDGRRIVFASNRDRDDRRDRSDLFTIRADGTRLRLLRDLPESQAEPDWSPNGRRIVFTTGRGLHWNVAVMRLRGPRLLRLTRCPGFPVRCDAYEDPAFSPDGRHVVVVADGTRSSSVEVMRSDGRRGTRTFDYESYDEEGFGGRVATPTWGPRPR